MKTKPMTHQLAGLQKCKDRGYFAFFMEQGTGKTWLALADIERLYNEGKLDTVIVFAPNGVHTNWARREIPAHLGVRDLAVLTYTSNQTRAYKRAEEQFFRVREVGEVPRLRILAISYDGAVTPRGFALCERVAASTLRWMAVADESQRIKNPAAARTKKLLELREGARYARLLSGTPIGRSPPDLFSQMEFLRSGLLGTTSHRAFVAEYADVMPVTHPLMVRMIERNPKAKFAQILEKNEDGTTRWRNLDKLSALIEPHSFRVLKKDCLDLPDKVYKTVYFELNAADRKRYDYLAQELRVDLGGVGAEEDILTVKKLAALVKLQQITSGFVMCHGEVMDLQEDPPRMAALVEALDEVEGQVIVWARFREEISLIASLLRRAGFSVAEYHGGVTGTNRELAVDGFQAGEFQFFVANQQAGGAGLTLTAAETVVYYSNDFDLLNRVQSEDRCHRIGTKKSVVYIDLCAQDTIDERITANLQAKKEVAAAVLGDLRDARKWE